FISLAVALGALRPKSLPDAVFACGDERNVILPPCRDNRCSERLISNPLSRHVRQRNRGSGRGPSLMQPLRDNARILVASAAGTAVEYYDFFLYGTAAALVFGPLFFPAQSAAAQTLY